MSVGVLYSLLGESRSTQCLSTLAYLCVGVLYSLVKAKPTATAGPNTPPPTNVPNTDLTLDKYGLVAEIAALCKW